MDKHVDSQISAGFAHVLGSRSDVDTAPLQPSRPTIRPTSPRRCHWKIELDLDQFPFVARGRRLLGKTMEADLKRTTEECRVHVDMEMLALNPGHKTQEETHGLAEGQTSHHRLAKCVRRRHHQRDLIADVQHVDESATGNSAADVRAGRRDVQRKS